MKNLNSISLALIYLTLSVGVIKNTHYCMGRVLDIAYFEVAEEPCMPGMEDMHCCSSELELLKIEDEQNTSPSFFNTKQLLEIQTLPALSELSISYIEVKDEITYNYALPPPRPAPIYKINCNYTYYG